MRDRDEVDDRRGDRDADEDRPHLEAGGEGERHELGLVAQLGDEDDAEGDERADEDGVHGTVGPLSVRPGRGARPRPGSMLPGSKVSPASPERGRAAGRPPENRRRSACRPRHWGLLPFAAPPDYRPRRAAVRSHTVTWPHAQRLRRTRGRSPARPLRSAASRAAAGRRLVASRNGRRPHEHEGPAEQDREPDRLAGHGERDQPDRDDDGPADGPGGVRMSAWRALLGQSQRIRRWWGRRCRSRGSCGRSWLATSRAGGPPRPCCPARRAGPPRSRRTPSTPAG